MKKLKTTHLNYGTTEGSDDDDTDCVTYDDDDDDDYILDRCNSNVCLHDCSNVRGY